MPSNPKSWNGPGPDEAHLIELVRLGSDVITHQVEMSRRYDRKSSHLLTLSAGVLVVTAALAGTSGRDAGPIIGAFLGLEINMVLASVMASFIFSSLGFAYFAISYVGSSRHQIDLVVGWKPHHLTEAAEQSDSLEKIHVSTILGIEKWYEQNQSMLKMNAALRRRGMIHLSLGGASLAIALIYAMGGIPQ